MVLANRNMVTTVFSRCFVSPCNNIFNNNNNNNNNNNDNNKSSRKPSELTIIMIITI